MINRLFILLFVITGCLNAQDLSQGYIANDLEQHPMQPLVKPDYLESVADPSFPNTQIRRISEAPASTFIAPMYSTIQAWNADESLMIVYGGGNHQLLNGQDYTFIRNLTDVNPDDIEAVFWSFLNPDVLFYMDNTTDDLISYNVLTEVKTVIVNIRTISNCPVSDGLTGGNDIQMMSWDDDVFSFRCGNTTAYYYRISTSTLTEFNIPNIEFTVPMPFPSGNLFFHVGNVYDTNGNFVRQLNANGIEHACLGKLSNGDDAYFAIGFEPVNGVCQGTLVAHNATDGSCFSVTPFGDYAYPKSGTHISSLAHKNAEDGWVAVSCLGRERDGKLILDQELFIAKVNESDAAVYRVAHHRSNTKTDEFNSYFAEPHVTISPTGTRLLFGSDWSSGGEAAGISVDSYIAELSSFTLSTMDSNDVSESIKIYKDSNNRQLVVKSDRVFPLKYTIYNTFGQSVLASKLEKNNRVDIKNLSNGLYFIKFQSQGESQTIKFIR